MAAPCELKQLSTMICISANVKFFYNSFSSIGCVIFLIGCAKKGLFQSIRVILSIPKFAN